MKVSVRKGFSFGLTSGIITTLGLMVGLTSGTHSTLAVIGGILVVAVADAFSDALGIHVSEEFGTRKSHKAVWESTIATFISKFFFALTFIIPILLFELNMAVMISVVWGLIALTSLNYFVAKKENANPFKVIREHLAIAVAVVIATYYIGIWISMVFV
jgi:VIT1/CCC1 family predicted Fe2+/Mn2+ transporter